MDDPGVTERVVTEEQAHRLAVQIVDAVEEELRVPQVSATHGPDGPEHLIITGSLFPQTRFNLVESIQHLLLTEKGRMD